MFEIIPFTHRNHIANYNPFKDLDDFQKAFFGDGVFSRNGMEPFRTDIKETENEYLLEADLPGFEKKDIHIDLNDDYLTIQAERHSGHEDQDEKKNYVRCERSYGAYSRSFDISGVDAEKITAKYDNGVLTLTMPKKEPEQPASRQLTIE